MLDRDKYTIHVKRFNFLGFEQQGSGDKILLREVKFLGETNNVYLTFKYFGLPPSLNKLLSLATG